MTGRGNPNEGKCTIEVIVDGAAEVEIRGDSAVLRNLEGAPAQWRRFECDGVMPARPADFRFQGVDGRGRQDLVRDPRNGGVAVVRITDNKGGSEGYTFDIMWGGVGGPQSGGNNQRPGYGNQTPGYGNQPPGYGNERPGYGNDRQGYGNQRFSAEQAIGLCREEVRQRASQRYGGGAVDFREMRMDDNPGRRDWVMGTFTMRSGRDRGAAHRFTCSVDFESGRLRSVELDNNGPGSGPGGQGRDFAARAAVDNCRRAVDERLRQGGYSDIRFSAIQADDGPGRNDWVVGNVRADRGRGAEGLDFSCRVNLNDGVVRSVDLNRGR